MQCSICYNDILNVNKVVTECNHTFHFSCLLKNFKNNPSTGEKCPLCRKPFLQSSSNNNNSNTYIPPVNPNTIINLIRQRLMQPARPPPPRNQIIRTINARRQESRITLVPRHRQIRTEIEKLSFNELKERLRREGLSTRGYVRENLEKRLFNKLTHQH